MNGMRVRALAALLSLVVALGACASSRHRPPPPLDQPAPGSSNLPPEESADVAPPPTTEWVSPSEANAPPATAPAER